MTKTWKGRPAVSPGFKARQAVPVPEPRQGRCGACNYEGLFYTNICPECSARVSS